MASESSASRRRSDRCRRLAARSPTASGARPIGHDRRDRADGPASSRGGRRRRRRGPRPQSGGRLAPGRGASSTGAARVDGQRPRRRAADAAEAAARLSRTAEPAAAQASIPLARGGRAARRGDARAGPRQPDRARAPSRGPASGRAAPPLRHRRDRQHPRGRRPGRGCRASRGAVHRGHPLDRAVAARPRPLRRDDRGLRRHVRDAGELPAHARRLDGLEPRDRPLRAPRQLLLGPLHARDRRDGRVRAPRHDVERRALRNHLSRHQPAADAHRPELLATDQRGRGRRDQHGRGQLPDHGRRGRAGAGGPRVAVHQRASRPGRRARGLADRARPRLRDRPDARRRPALTRSRRRGGPRDLPGRAAEVHAARPST